MSLGVAEGDTNQEFGSIGGIALLHGGVIAVLDGQGESAYTFRIFDSAGMHVATHGRLGRGPGDFAWVKQFGATTGDTIFAVGFPNQRLNYLTVPDGYHRPLQVDQEASGGGGLLLPPLRRTRLGARISQGIFLQPRSAAYAR